MKFDYVIGNPPYQEMYNGNSSGANSVYDKFLDASHEVADKVEMIHPARFLFNAGSTPKAWNEKMLNNPHFKILLIKFILTHESQKININAMIWKLRFTDEKTKWTEKLII